MMVPTDSSLLVKKDKPRITIILVYVDDLIIIGDDKREIHRVKKIY